MNLDNCSGGKRFQEHTVVCGSDPLLPPSSSSGSSKLVLLPVYQQLWRLWKPEINPSVLRGALTQRAQVKSSSFLEFCWNFYFLWLFTPNQTLVLWEINGADGDEGVWLLWAQQKLLFAGETGWRCFCFCSQLSWAVYPVKNSSGIRLKWELVSLDVCPGPAQAARLPATNKDKKNRARFCGAWRRRLAAPRSLRRTTPPRIPARFVGRCWTLPRKCQKKSSLRLSCSAGNARFITKSFLLLTLSMKAPPEPGWEPTCTWSPAEPKPALSLLYFQKVKHKQR